MDTQGPASTALRLVQAGSFIYVRLMDSGDVEGEKPGRLWYQVQVERPGGSSWNVQRAGGTDLGEALIEAMGGGTIDEGGGRFTRPKRVIRRVPQS